MCRSPLPGGTAFVPSTLSQRRAYSPKSSYSAAVKAACSASLRWFGLRPAVGGSGCGRAPPLSSLAPSPAVRLPSQSHFSDQPMRREGLPHADTMLAVGPGVPPGLGKDVRAPSEPHMASTGLAGNPEVSPGGPVTCEQEKVRPLLLGNSNPLWQRGSIIFPKSGLGFHPKTPLQPQWPSAALAVRLETRHDMLLGGAGQEA